MLECKVNPMNIVFRVDASKRIGSGHLMRCLILADEWKQIGAKVSFISREFPEHLAEWIIGKRRFVLHALSAEEVQMDAAETIAVLKREQQVDFLIVDHYGLDYAWEHQMWLCGFCCLQICL